MRLVVSLCLLLACNSGDRKEGDGKPTSAEPAGVFHSLDRGESQGFRGGQLAVGGGYVYWVHQPRIDRNGLGKSTLERKKADGGAVETVAGPGDIYSIAADGENVYWSDKRAIWSLAHAGGEPAKLTGGAMWLEVVPGKSHVFLRSSTRMAMVAKTGGDEEVVWQGKRSKQHVIADGDRFLVVEESSERSAQPTGSLTAFAPGEPPEILVQNGPATGAVGVDGEHIIFSGGRNVTPPLWRIPRAGGSPEKVGNPSWGFGEFVVARGALYGMVFTNKWKLQKLPLDGGAPAVIDDLRGFTAMVTALAADEKHVYFLTDFDVKRVPL
jgi:hypothetical protein